jgi:hypothetical protein
MWLPHPFWEERVWPTRWFVACSAEGLPHNGNIYGENDDEPDQPWEDIWTLTRIHVHMLIGIGLIV